MLKLVGDGQCAMADDSPSVDHRLRDEERHVHYDWSRTHDPVLTVCPGETVRFDCRSAATVSGPDPTVDDLGRETWRGHPLTGPVAVETASPGDVLTVELLDFQPLGHGYTYFYPSDAQKGLLPEEFDRPALHVWDIGEKVAEFVDGIEVPIDPFPGCVGVAPAEPGPHGTMPPRNVGGNLDVKHLTAGSTVYLPVEVDGALFSLGDCHAAQGDGEVCLTGIEAPMSVTARFDVRSDMDIRQPQFETTGPFTPTGGDEPMHATTGIDSDLMEATKKAIRHMIDHLHDRYGLSQSDAYLLCSVAVDLKINQVVDAPNWTVSAYLPKSLFPSEA